METLLRSCLRHYNTWNITRAYVININGVRNLSLNKCLRDKNEDDDHRKPDEQDQEAKKDVKKRNETKKYTSAKEKSKKEKPEVKEKPQPVSAISSQIIQQILDMQTSESKGDNVDSKLKLNLAKPLDKRGKKREARQITAELQKEAPDLNVELIKATREVAESIGGDVNQTKSELLSRLLDHSLAKSAQSFKEVKGIISDMSVELPSKKTSKKMIPDAGLHSALSMRGIVKTDLFGSKRLNIFSKKTQEEMANENLPQLTTWERLRQRELDLLAVYPPRNAYEEEILWLKQGKTWKFPIDNEQGMDEERKVPFHEHVFLEHLISDMPKKGPVARFMELVIVGLSKNPYITVEQKKADIQWFKDYLKDKEAMLKEAEAI